jgi:hypothetical protein
MDEMNLKLAYAGESTATTSNENKVQCTSPIISGLRASECDSHVSFYSQFLITNKLLCLLYISLTRAFYSILEFDGR